MSREEFLDGVRVTDIGRNGGFKMLDGKAVAAYSFKAYDSSGNPFYGNYPSLKEAKKAIKELKSKGKEAVIGPAAPGIYGETGKLFKIENPDEVGVYIVNAKGENER